MGKVSRGTRHKAPEPSLRIGQGLDVHPLSAGRRLVLGGVRVPHDRGLAGHSDADVLSHAVCDALLGALGLPDIGQRFPAGETRHRNRSSLAFLREIAAAMRSHRMEVVNLDAVLMAESPRLLPYLEQMRQRIARALGSEPARVTIKLKRGEGIGAIGRCEGMMAQAVVLLRSIPGPAPARRSSLSGRAVRPRSARRPRAGR